MIDSTILLTDLRRRLRLLERDLAERADDVPAMEDSLAGEYRTARNVGRTGDPFGAWRSAELTQTAVHGCSAACSYGSRRTTVCWRRR